MEKTRDMQIAEILKKNFKPKGTVAFINMQYAGYFTYDELKELEAEARNATRKIKDSAEEKAFAYVYAYYDFDDNGELQSAHFYSDYPKTEAEYGKLSQFENIDVRAIFPR